MSTQNAIQAENQRDLSMEGKYLTFELAREEFGISILTVKEIIGMMTTTPVPSTPSWVLGVINLRGKVIPVVDLRLKFGMESRPFDDRTCIVVAEVNNQDELLNIGVVVDSVNEVANVKEQDVEKTPSFGVELETDYIQGMAKNGEHVCILLDINKVLGGEAIAQLRSAA